MDCVFVSVQNAYVETLTPNRTVLGGEVFGSDHVMKVRPLTMELVPTR